MKNKIIIAIELILVMGIIAGGGYYINEQKKVSEFNKATEEIKKTITLVDSIAVDKGKSNAEKVATPDVNKKAIIEVEKLKKLHPSVTAIINIPGTDILYPIVQGKDNEFYLNHDKDGNPHKFGEVFLDYRNNSDFTDGNSIIYGHNISFTKAIFSELMNYEKQNFFDSHRFIEIYSTGGYKKFKIVSVFKAKPNEPYRKIDFKDSEIFSFQKLYHSKSIVTSDLIASDSMLTISTCFDEDDRFVLQAVRVE